MRHGIWILSLCLAACSHSPVVRAPDSESGMPPTIIDAHAHLDGVWNQGSVEEFERNHVEAVLTHAPLENPTPAKPGRPFPFKVRVCAGVGPKTTVKQVEKALAEGRVGCLKIYLGYVRRWATDPLYQPFYKLAEKRGVVVVFHTGDTLDKDGFVKYADPLTIDEIAVTYRKVKFLIAHLGNPWFQSAAEVAYKNDNVYLDTSALMIEDISQEDPETIDQLIVKPVRWMFHYVENPKKFLFGTDWPLTKIGPYVQAMQKAIPKEHWNAVFRQNAIDLFGF